MRTPRAAVEVISSVRRPQRLGLLHRGDELLHSKLGELYPAMLLLQTAVLLAAGVRLALTRVLPAKNRRRR